MVLGKAFRFKSNIIFFQIASGMEFLSSRAIYHGDLACRNILLTEALVAKISDFGLSHRLYGNQSSDVKSDDDLPFRWTAIEVLNMQNYSLQSDIWSFGIVLWEIFQLGKEPYFIEGNLLFGRLKFYVVESRVTTCFLSNVVYFNFLFFVIPRSRLSYPKKYVIWWSSSRSSCKCPFTYIRPYGKLLGGKT